MNIIDEINEVVDKGKPVKPSRRILYLLVLNALNLLISDFSIFLFVAGGCLFWNYFIFKLSRTEFIIDILLIVIVIRLCVKKEYDEAKIEKRNIKAAIQFLKGKETSTK